METKQLELYYREQSHSRLSLPRAAPWHSLLAPPPLGMQPRARACHAHAALAPKAMEAAHGQPPLALPAPGCSLGTGSELDAALPGVRQVRTHVLRGCRDSSTICPPFLLPAQDLDVLGEHSQAPQQTLLQAPPGATALVGTGISRVLCSFPALQQQEEESTPKSEF